MTIAAVLLAAGGGSRFAGSTHKLLATIGGVPVFRRALDHVSRGRLRSCHRRHRRGCPGNRRTRVITVHNSTWHTGQAGSLQLALSAAGDLDSDFVVVGLADQPFVPGSAWQAVANSASTAPIVVATYDGVRGPNPVRLQRSVWPHLPTDGDEGARTVMRLHPDWVDEVACEGSAADIDTLEDLGQWTNF